MIATHRGRRRAPTPEKGSEAPKTLRERWTEIRSAFRNVPKAFTLVWEAHRVGTVLMALITLVSGILPISQAWIGKLIVDAVVRSVNTNTGAQAGISAALPFLIAEFALITVGSALTQGRTLVEHVLNARLTNRINTAIIRKALALDLHYFEDAQFYDKLQNARRESNYRALSIINTSFNIAQASITLISFAAALLAFSPLVALILFGATVPSFIAQSKYGKLNFRLLTWRAPEFRRMNYLEHLLTVDHSVKEIKLFGLGEPLLKRYQPTSSGSSTTRTRPWPRRRSLISMLWGLLASARVLRVLRLDHLPHRRRRDQHRRHDPLPDHLPPEPDDLPGHVLQHQPALRERPVPGEPLRLPVPRPADGQRRGPRRAPAHPGAASSSATSASATPTARTGRCAG